MNTPAEFFGGGPWQGRRTIVPFPEHPYWLVPELGRIAFWDSETEVINTTETYRVHRYRLIGYNLVGVAYYEYEGVF